jgi:hypothetical protein
LLLFWGYIVTFAKVLTIYRSQIHALHHSALFPPPPIPKSFNRYHFYTFIHEYIVFLSHSPFYTLSLYPPFSHWYQPPYRTCFTLLFPIFEKKFFVHSRYLSRVFHCDIYIYMYYKPNWFIPSIFLLSTLVPFCNRSKNSIFILV